MEKAKLVIHPTGTCFDDMADLFARFVNKNDCDELFLCHGVIVLDDGRRAAHAWIEKGQLVYQCGMVNGHRAFYSGKPEEIRMKVIEKTCYSLEWISENLSREDRSGPWEERYARLCVD